ncbi:MAG: helix-turn-helix transcriptional regulator [Sulfurimonas sp.]|jgi:transcriptional regulator with XRE-family HTH domain
MTKKEISEILGIDQNTIKNWERNRPELHKIVMEHFQENRTYPDINNPEYLKKEMIKAIDTLPHTKVKKFYHLMMAELAEMGH